MEQRFRNREEPTLCLGAEMPELVHGLLTRKGGRRPTCPEHYQSEIHALLTTQIAWHQLSPEESAVWSVQFSAIEGTINGLL